MFTLAQISARTAASLVKKLSGSDKAKFIKFGLTSKGQPWIVYRVDDKKCSQFISKKEWDFTKPEIFFASEIRITSDMASSTTPYLSGLYSLVNLRKNSRYEVSYYRRNENTPAITNCGCPAGQFKKSCKHQLLVKYLGDRRYDSMLADYKKESVPVPVSNPTPSGYIHPAQKEADRVWADNLYRSRGNTLRLDNDSIYLAGIIRRAGAAQTKYVIESASYGTFLINTEVVAEISQPASQPAFQPASRPASQAFSPSLEIARQKFDEIWNNPKQDFVFIGGRKGKRVSSLIRDTYNPHGTGYMIFELNDCNFLVKKATESVSSQLQSTKVPPVISSKVSEIRSDISRKRSSAASPLPSSPAVSFSSVFGGSSIGDTKVVWTFVGEDTWSSTLGGHCFSADLEANVRADLALGLEVICRSTKRDYFCSFSSDGKILKQAISRFA